MMVSEYEERFRPPAPSVHQVFIDMHGSKWTRRRGRRLWIAAALLGLMTATTGIASHRTADTGPGQGSRHCRLISDGPRIAASTATTMPLPGRPSRRSAICDPSGARSAAAALPFDLSC